VFNHHYEDLYSFPWDRKRPKAFMRASQQGCMESNSTRAVLAVLSEDHPERCGGAGGAPLWEGSGERQALARSRECSPWAPDAPAHAAPPSTDMNPLPPPPNPHTPRPPPPPPPPRARARATPLAPPPPPASLDLGITRIDGAQKHNLKYRFSKAGFVSIEDHAKWWVTLGWGRARGGGGRAIGARAPRPAWRQRGWGSGTPPLPHLGHLPHAPLSPCPPSSPPPPRKYQVSADGCVAQTRLAKVMLTNSVVLKEESAWIEYYYRRGGEAGAGVR
jgi:hypothetical protein